MSDQAITLAFFVNLCKPWDLAQMCGKKGKYISTRVMLKLTTMRGKC